MLQNIWLYDSELKIWACVHKTLQGDFNWKTKIKVLRNSISILSQLTSGLWITFGWTLYGAGFILRKSSIVSVLPLWFPPLADPLGSGVLWACSRLCWATVSDYSAGFIESTKQEEDAVQRLQANETEASGVWWQQMVEEVKSWCKYHYQCAYFLSFFFSIVVDFKYTFENHLQHDLFRL